MSEIEKNLQTVLQCPYCMKSFKAGEMHYVTGDNINCFESVIKPKADAAKGFVMNFGGARPSTAVNAGPTSSVSGTPAGQEKKEEQLFGVAGAKDIIAEGFLSRYGLGPIFRFNRMGTFYKVCKQEEIDEHPDCGYPTKWDGPAPAQIVVRVDDKEKKINKRLCPKCHCELPLGYYGTPSDHRHTVALAGMTSAGKTQFITMGLNSLGEYMSSLSLGSVDVEVCSRWFLNCYLNQIKVRNGTDATDVNLGLLPFVLKIEPRKHLESADDKAHFILIHDIAGEMAKPEHMDGMANYAHYDDAEAIMLMVDSTYLFSDNIPSVDREEAHPSTQDALDALRAIRDYTDCKDNCRRILAVLTKIDKLMGGQDSIVHGNMHGLSNGMLLYENDMSDHKGAVNLDVLDKIDKEIEDRILSKKREQYREDIKSTFGTPDAKVRFYGVSTLIREGDAFVMSPDSKVGRHRLVEPFLGLMGELGILPCARNGIQGDIARAQAQAQEEEAQLAQTQVKKKGLFGRRRNNS